MIPKNTNGCNLTVRRRGIQKNSSMMTPVKLLSADPLTTPMLSWEWVRI